MSSEEEILFAVKGAIGLVTLNRPKALNALTHEMCLLLNAKLREWEKDDRVHAVVIEGAGDRAFCAGGDIVKLYNEGKSGGDYPYHFYRDEYLLNTRIKHFPKPYIALIDGIVMGGGVGVSVHGSHRIATERTLFAMPESGIGLFPDVGGTYFLPRLEGELGMYLGLTGARLKTADSVFAGIAHGYIPAEKLPEVKDALAAHGFAGDAKAEVDRVLAGFTTETEAAPIAETLPAINRHFAKDSVVAIIESLQSEDDALAATAADSLLTKSPTSMKLTYQQLRRGKSLDFDDCMRMEFRMVNRVIQGVDFYEGTRAAVIDKDQSPKWTPATLDEVSDAAIEEYFAPLPDGELF
ncbi:enoyl-CoA hydratase/isomerase family protein [Sneathiella chungangensis]|uniref:3-hydroxyisobutyryl-CoA hydrolase n=1 Tax=Sneathiella chungangensis TaxID=1418234 RepID=A0A845ME52_9PROT|nr:enoyl-CoA hydratase/isomerase family protein [Sneathiella chungangensis]MZR21527.1 enoyl-CoA hydratase/isomerase family protein [Sneathiella chungangensis]